MNLSLINLINCTLLSKALGISTQQKPTNQSDSDTKAYDVAVSNLKDSRYFY